MMELFFKCWSVLQVVVIVVCIQRNVLSVERVQGCVGSQLSLRCPATKIIKVTAVVLGDSACRGASCCIKDSDCTRNANANHRTDVNSRCDNKQSCTVGVLRERISCGFLGLRANNDFERITYICIDDPQRSTTARVSRPASTVHMLRTSERKTENGSTTARVSRPASTVHMLRTSERKIEYVETSISTDVQSTEGSDQTINGHDDNVTHEDRLYTWSTAATFSRPDSTEDSLSTKNNPTERETENGVTTTPTDVQTSEGPDQNGGEHDERGTHEDPSDNSWSATVTFSKPDSTEDILHRPTEENPRQEETENDETTKSTDIQSKEGSEQNVSINGEDETTTSIDSRNKQGVDQDTDGHDQNVTHEDNAHGTTTSSDVEKREGSQDKHGPNEKRPYNSYNTTSSIAAKAAIEVKNEDLQDQNINGRHEKRVHDEHSGNSWFLPVVMPTVCILVLIAIVAAVAMMRRKRLAKGSGGLELTDINGAMRNGAIHSNEKQTMKTLNNGTESSNHGNDMMKNSRYNGATASETCEIPDNVFGSFADGAGSRPTEDPTLFKSRDYQPISYQDQHQTFAA